jgi:phosphonopyruvate decarboxylase
MINTTDFVDGIKNAGIEFITGVPDSLLKEICAHITQDFPPTQHIIATNEGSAVGLAMGHFLGSGKPAVVYMQNSGLGNALNPLVSLVDPKVYAIPMLLLIGWRAELDDDLTQMGDEPQHKKQGLITLDILKILEIPFHIISSRTKDIKLVISNAMRNSIERSGPVALVVRKDTFKRFESLKISKEKKLLTRELAIMKVLDYLPNDASIVSTTGMISRELYEIRKENEQLLSNIFLTVGGMGHANQISAGIALSNPSKKVVCLDGDGAILMHTGGLSISADCDNLLHIVLNNGVHDSVGGQPTKGQKLNFVQIAEAMGYKNFELITDLDDFESRFKRVIEKRGSSFVEIRCKPGSRNNLSRPKNDLLQRKENFMKFVGKKSSI